MTTPTPELEQSVQSASIVELCLGTDDSGEQIFVYTAIPLTRYDAYKEAAYSGNAFNPSDFGEIVAQGKGTPPKTLIDELQTRYGFWDGFEDKMNELGHVVLSELDSTATA